MYLITLRREQDATRGQFLVEHCGLNLELPFS